MDIQSKLAITAFIMGFGTSFLALYIGPSKSGIALMRCGVGIFSLVSVVISFYGLSIETDTIRMTAEARRFMAGFGLFISSVFLFGACFGRDKFIREWFKEIDNDIYHAPLFGESKVISGADRVRNAEREDHKDE